jgi:hypothetical protein
MGVEKVFYRESSDLVQRHSQVLKKVDPSVKILGLYAWFYGDSLASIFNRKTEKYKNFTALVYVPCRNCQAACFFQ